MKIEKPVEDVDLFIIYDLLEEEEMNDLLKASSAKFLQNPVHSNYYEELKEIGRWEVREASEFMEGVPENITKRGYRSLDIAREKTKSLMRECYPDLDLQRFNDFGDISIRTPEHQTRMKPHVDGPPEIDRPDHGVNNLGSNYYLNDQYVGGELYYPQLNFSYKPVPNSLVIHRGIEQFRHGVRDVTSGVRLSFGMFAFEHYDAKLFSMGEGKDSDECRFELRRDSR